MTQGPGWGYGAWGQDGWGGVSPPDTLAPIFAGLVTATAVGDAVYLQWDAATDDVTLPPYIAYRVYRATTSGAENFGSPIITTALGQLSYLDAGLTPGTTYYYVVRALDQEGNQDTNVVEHFATPSTGGGGGGGSEPTITNFVPPAGTSITPTTAIQFDVLDDEADFARIFVEVAFPDSTGITEVVHDGEGFQGLYSAASSRGIITGGFRYTVRRSGGWPGTPSFRVFAIDHAGNEGATT